MFLEYIKKKGPSLGEDIRKDRRPRPDGSGGLVTRPPSTWQEAHAVVTELEAIRAGTRALTTARTAGQTQGGSKDERDPKGKGKGKGKGVCHNMRDHGSCRFGDKCRFSHDPTEIKKARQALTEADAEGDEDGSSDSDKPRRKKWIMCRHVVNPQKYGECPDGPENCPYAHDKEELEAKPKAKAKARARSEKGSHDGRDVWGNPPGNVQYGYGQKAVIVGDLKVDGSGEEDYWLVYDREGSGTASRYSRARREADDSLPSSAAVRASPNTFWQDHSAGGIPYWGVPVESDLGATALARDPSILMIRLGSTVWSKFPPTAASSLDEMD